MHKTDVTLTSYVHKTDVTLTSYVHKTDVTLTSYEIFLAKFLFLGLRLVSLKWNTKQRS